MYKISDFKLAKYIIKAACSKQDCSFVDLEVCFSDSGDFLGLENNKIFIGKPYCLNSTIFNIIYVYFDNFDKITGSCLFENDDYKNQVLLIIACFIKALGYNGKMLSKSKPSSPVVTRLYEFRLVWVILKNIICPLYSVDLINTKVIAGGSPFIDVSSYNESDEDEGFIYLNTDISYEPYYLADILLSAIESYGLNKYSVIEDLVDSDLYDTLKGIALLEFDDEKQVNEFISFLHIGSNCEQKIEKLVYEFDDSIKMAQSNIGDFDQLQNSWWFMGLIESLLEPVRGSDWNTHDILKDINKELWEKIEKKKKESGRNGVPYEMLLRIKDEENKPEDIKLIEKRLGSDRIW